ncbi:MAG TPA: DUF3426 domain-containing protein [Dongiaceae bacterium]|nr:DUF3426 domain-containing protein [Dongiaceae bacterium]
MLGLGGPGLPGRTGENYNVPDALIGGPRKSVIVACPSCQARFNLDPAKLLPAGRNVRCAKCGHRWRQMPEGMEEADAAEPTALEPPGPVPSIPEPPPPEPEPAPEPVAAAPAEEAEPHPPSPPETPAEMARSLAAIAEQVAGGGRGEGYTVSQGAPQGGPQNPIARLGRRGGQTMGPITVPPRMRPMRPAKRNSRLTLILVAGLAIGLLAAAYVFRDVIARTVPGADALYSLLNLSTDNPAADLEISIDHTGMRKDESGQQVFEVRATVFNLSDYPVDMPVLMIVPVDDAGSQLEPLEFRLHEQVVQPGQNIKFQKSFDNWPPTAPNFVLSVADAP